MNYEYMKKHNESAEKVLLNQPKMSVEEMIEQTMSNKKVMQDRIEKEKQEKLKICRRYAKVAL